MKPWWMPPGAGPMMPITKGSAVQAFVLVRDLTAPFGGCGISGIGREGGEHALDFHADVKTVMILDGTTS